MQEAIEEIRRALQLYREKPDRTSRLKLRKKTYNGWTVLAQNPQKDSVYARLNNAGLPVAHIIDESSSDFIGFTIRNIPYLKPNFLEQHFSPQLLNSELEPYFVDMEVKRMAGVAIYYTPDDRGKAMVVKLNNNKFHTGLRLDIIQEME